MNRLITILLVFICLTGYAQPEATLELGKKSDIIDVMSLGNDGFVINTGSKKEIQLASFKANLSQRWALKLQTTDKISHSNSLIVSPESNCTYFVDYWGFSTWSKSTTVYVVRIDSTGKREDIDYKIKNDQKGTEGIGMFADNDNLYRVGAAITFTPEKGKNYPAKGKKEGKIILFIMNKSEKEIRSVETDIKIISNHVHSHADLGIEFLGHDGEYIYLAKRSLDRSENVITYDIITLDKSGKTVETSQFVASIGSKMTQAMNIRNIPGAEAYGNDYSFWDENGVFYYSFNEGMYGCAKLDISNGYFYVYGLSRSNKFPIAKNQSGGGPTTEETNANCIYVCKYDFTTGDLISKNETQFDKSIFEDLPFSNPIFGQPNYRYIWFDVVDSETVRIGGTSLYSSGLLHVTALNTRTGKTAYIGKVVKQKITMTGRYGNMVYRTFFANAMVTKLDASKETIDYINKFPDFNGKKIKILGICLGDKTVLVRNYASTKTPKVEFHLLDNSNR